MVMVRSLSYSFQCPSCPEKTNEKERPPKSPIAPVVFMQDHEPDGQKASEPWDSPLCFPKGPWDSSSALAFDARKPSP